jgi:hypothetical protein
MAISPKPIFGPSLIERFGHNFRSARAASRWQGRKQNPARRFLRILLIRHCGSLINSARAER